MTPEYIVNEVKKEREEILYQIEDGGEELFTVSEIARGVWKNEKADEKDDRRGKRKIMASVIRNLCDLCEERRIGEISAVGEKWYGAHQAIANLQQMLDEIKK